MEELPETGKLEAKLVNFFGSGQFFTETAGSRHRNKMVFNGGGFVFQVFQDPRALPAKKKLEGSCFVSSLVVVEDLPSNRAEEAIEVLEDICWLLTFAGMSRVVVKAVDYSGKKPIHRGIFPEYPSRKFRHPIRIGYGNEVMSFVEQCYPRFCELKQTRKLREIFDYLSRIEWKGQALEVQLILAFVVLESLKYTFAELKKIPKNSKGQFLYKNGKPPGV